MLRPLIIASIGLAAAACSPPASEENTASDMGGMDMSAPAATGPIQGAGTVTAVDAAAGTVTLNHEPIAALSWPTMTMQFTVEDPTALQGIEAGDSVTFDLKSAEESQVITAIREQ